MKEDKFSHILLLGMFIVLLVSPIYFLLSSMYNNNDIGDKYISELEYLYQEVENNNVVDFQTFQSRYEKIYKLKKEMYVENDELSKKQRIKEVKIIDKIKLLSDEKFKEFESKLENMFD